MKTTTKPKPMEQPTMTKKELKNYIKGLVDFLATQGCSLEEQRAINDEILNARMYLDAANSIKAF